jgi:DNA-binding transcriptional LysR family regulator
MNTKEFEYIVEIANQESISKAAARLYLSQPTLTKFLKKMEDEFGTPLFDRIGKKMIPTAAGKCCVEQSKRILEIHDQMTRDIQSLKDVNHGCIRIGTSASRGEFFINRVLPQMMQKYPDLSFHLCVEAKGDLMKKLDTDELDIIFVSNYSERPYLEYARIAQEEMVLVVPEDHPLFDKAIRSEAFRYPFVQLDDWISYPFICANARMTTGQYTRLLFQHYQKQPPIVLEVHSLQMIYSAVGQKLGITIAPSMPLCQIEHQNLRYLSFEDEQNVQWYFTGIRKSQIAAHPAIRELIQVVTEQYY